MKSVLGFLILSLALIFTVGLYGQSNNSQKASKPNLEKAQFDQNKLEELAEESSFDYNRKYIPRNYSIRELISRWINDKIRWFFRLMGDNSDISRNLFYIISIFGMSYLLVKLLKLDKSFAFYTNTKQNNNPEIFTENIYELDMEAALKAAVAAKEFKKAVRVLYLSTLKNLDKNGLIEWQLHKTNHDYESEIKEEEVRSDFISLTRYFEYIIYGSFTLDQVGFKKAEKIYENVKNRIVKQVV